MVVLQIIFMNSTVGEKQKGKNKSKSKFVLLNQR